MQRGGARRRFWPEIALCLLALAVFGQVAGFGFLRYDDPVAVTENPALARGLTADALRWAVTTPHDGNWIPLTSLSHALDVQLFGLRPAGHHLASLFFHLCNGLLLYRLLLGLTGMRLRALVAAALFLVHPLQVESVAWVAQRKGPLMLFFGLLALHAWLGWVRRRSPARYGRTVLFFLLGLAAKPLLVTLPLLMLLLDFWPLGRREAQRRLAAEKAPLLAGALAGGLIAMRTQAGAMVLEERLTLGAKALHAAGAPLWYLAKAIFPTGLAPFYPYPLQGPSAALALAGVCVTLAGTGVALRYARRSPWLPVGWFWFLIALAPVAGLTQVGEQARADRYAYLPLVGCSLLAAWGPPQLAKNRHAPRVLFPLAACAAMVVLAAAAFRQAGFWRDDERLNLRALAVTEGNWVAFNNLGSAAFRAGDPERAAALFREAVRLAPHPAKAHANLGQALLKLGRVREAIPEFGEAVRENPGEHRAWTGLGQALELQGRPDEALAAYEEARRVRPEDPRASSLIMVLQARKRAAGLIPSPPRADGPGR